MDLILQKREFKLYGPLSKKDRPENLEMFEKSKLSNVCSTTSDLLHLKHSPER